MRSTAMMVFAFFCMPTLASADLVISGTVNGSDITNATTRENAIPVPYSKPIYVQGAVRNTGEETVHLVKVVVDPGFAKIAKREYPTDSYIAPGQSRAGEKTVTISDLIEQNVSGLLSLVGSFALNGTTMSATVTAYQEGSLTPVAQKTVWVHIDDSTEVVPKSAIEAVGQSPGAQAGAALATVSALAGAAHTVNTRKRRQAGTTKGKGVKGKAAAAVGVSLGAAIVLLKIGAVSIGEFLEFGVIEGLSAGAIMLILALFL